MYLGNTPPTSFETIRKQVSTSNSGTTITLDFPVTNVQDILVTVDAVIQSYDNYSLSAGGTVLNLGGTLNNNRVEILYVGRTFGSVNAPDNSVTTAQLQNNSVTSSKLNGLGNYVVEKIDVYTNGTVVTGTGSISYIDIAGGNYLTFTPTSTSDYILFKGMCMIYVASQDRGVGLGIKRDTSTSISGSSDTVEFQGRYAMYSSSSSNYYAGNIIGSDTGLTAGTTYYYEMYGGIHSDGGNKKFNFNSTDSVAGSRHKLIGIHYKYIG